MRTLDDLTSRRPSPLWRIPVLLAAAAVMTGLWVSGELEAERAATAGDRRLGRARLDSLRPSLEAAAARPLTAPLRLPDECRRYGDRSPRWREQEIAEDRIERLVEGGVRGVIVVRYEDPGLEAATTAVEKLGARIIAPLPGVLVGSAWVYCVPDNADGQGLDRALAWFARDRTVWDAWRRVPEGVLTDSAGRSLDDRLGDGAPQPERDLPAPDSVAADGVPADSVAAQPDSTVEPAN